MTASLSPIIASVVWLVFLVLKLVYYVIITQVIMSWLINFNIINTRQQFVYTVWSTLERLTGSLYRPLRRVLPDMGGIDFAPLIVLIGVMFLEHLLSGYFPRV
jgi:YggT family protein